MYGNAKLPAIPGGAFHSGLRFINSMFEEITEILNRASRYDFRLLPLYAECQSVADETQRLLGDAPQPGGAENSVNDGSPSRDGGRPRGGSGFRKAA